jgi:hypothetical protein
MKHLIKFENIDNNSSEYDNDIRDIKDILLELEDEFPYIEISVSDPTSKYKKFRISIDTRISRIEDDSNDDDVFGSDVYSIEYNLNRLEFTKILMGCVDKITKTVLGKTNVHIEGLFFQNMDEYQIIITFG